MRTFLIVMLCLVAVACEDPREKFMGVWSGPMMFMVTGSSGTTSTPLGEVRFEMIAPIKTNHIWIDYECGYTAEVAKDNATRLEINKTACPSRRVTISSTRTCDYIASATGGQGILDGDTLDFAMSEEGQFANCTSGGNTSYKYVTSGLATKARDP
jgi:hypothetical protein